MTNLHLIRTVNLCLIQKILVSFLDYDVAKRVEAGRTLRRSRVWSVPRLMALVKKIHALKPASSNTV